MNEITRSRIRHVFLSPRPNIPLMSAADLLGMTLNQLKREIDDGAIVAVSTRLGQRVTREEMIAAAMRVTSRRSSKRLSGTMRRISCRRRSGWWSYARGCRGISGRCCGIWRGGMRQPWTLSLPGNWRMWRARIRRNSRKRWPDSVPR